MCDRGHDIMMNHDLWEDGGWPGLVLGVATKRSAVTIELYKCISVFSNLMLLHSYYLQYVGFRV